MTAAIQKLETEGKIITCILPKGCALPLMEALSRRGVTRISFAFARGSNVDDLDVNKKGLPIEEEKEIVTVIAKDATEGEELFDFIYEKGNIHREDGGFMTMAKLSHATPFTLPELDKNETKEPEVAKESPRPPEVRA